MSNLPPGVKMSDSDAPWNEEHPTPDYWCPSASCSWASNKYPSDGKCPRCGKDIEE